MPMLAVLSYSNCGASRGAATRYDESNGAAKLGDGNSDDACKESEAERTNEEYDTTRQAARVRAAIICINMYAC